MYNHVCIQEIVNISSPGTDRTNKVTLLLQDKDLSEASTHISDVSAKVKRLDQQCQECRRMETEARRQASEWKRKYADARKQTEKLKSECFMYSYLCAFYQR